MQLLRPRGGEAPSTSKPLLGWPGMVTVYSTSVLSMAVELAGSCVTFLGPHSSSSGIGHNAPAEPLM